MEEQFRKQSSVLVEQLSKLCTMRLVVESKQQILLSRSIYLSRFIKIAALDHVKGLPEMENARKMLALTLPDFKIEKSNPGWANTGLHDRLNSPFNNLN
jgi:hypothetical protein